MDKAGERSKRKKNRILQSAVDLFLETGIKKVTMDDIAGRANVSKMTVYKYFKDKESLYGYTAAALAETCRRDLAEKLAQAESAARRMVSCTAVLTEFIAHGYWSLSVGLGDLNIEAKAEFEKLRADTENAILQLIREGKRSGLIREDVSDACICHFIDMGLTYFLHNTDYREKILRDSLFRKEYMDFLWSSVFTDITCFSTEITDL
jgi:AcrR family transcriptional regulator